MGISKAEIERESVCVPVCWSGGESCGEIPMRAVTLCLSLKHAHTYTHLPRICPSISSSESDALSPSPSLPLSLFISPALALSLRHPSPSFSSSPHTHVLPLLPQMGWVESWLRTFMPKTTCHPSLLLSRMVML